MGEWFLCVDLFNFVEVMKDAREGDLSSKKVLKKFGGIVEKTFLIETNAFATQILTVDNRLFNMSLV